MDLWDLHLFINKIDGFVTFIFIYKQILWICDIYIYL